MRRSLLVLSALVALLLASLGVAATAPAQDPPPEKQCGDGEDNDNDGKTDQDDPGCDDADDDSEDSDPPPADDGGGNSSSDSSDDGGNDQASKSGDAQRRRREAAARRDRGPAVRPPPQRLNPFPIVRVKGLILRGGVRVQVLSVNAPAGAKVEVRCHGKRCPVRLQEVPAATTTAGPEAVFPAVRLVNLTAFQGRFFRAGVTLVVRVTRPGHIGKVTRLRIRNGKPPLRTDLCLVPGTRPAPCKPDGPPPSP